MSKDPTNLENVLQALRNAGPAGCLTAELCHPNCGGERFGGRIEELRKAGWPIESKYHRPKSWRYTLTGPQRVLAAVPDPAPATGPRPLVLPVWHVCDACSYRFKGNEWPQACPSCHRPPHWLCSFHEKSHAIDYVPFCDREQKAAA